MATVSGASLLLRKPLLTMPRWSIADVPQLGRHAGERQLFGFSSLMRCGLIFSGPHSREERVRARRGVHVAGQCLGKGNSLAVERLGGIIVLLDHGTIYRDSSK